MALGAQSPQIFCKATNYLLCGVWWEKVGRVKGHEGAECWASIVNSKLVAQVRLGLTEVRPRPR
jgi:hypothetical protein